jgi:membrane protease YdiL (CAAX protease family)
MRRLRPADVAAGVAGVALLVTLFLPWYEPRGVPAVAGWTAYAPLGRRLTAWQSLTVVDILLALAALTAIAIVVVTATASGPAKPVASALIATVASGIALLLVLWRALDPPQGYLVRCYGVWVALAVAALMFAASFAALRDERTPGAVPPDVPRRPAPPA